MCPCPLGAEEEKTPVGIGRRKYARKGVVDVQIHPDVSHIQADSGSTYASHVRHSNLLTSYGLKAQCSRLQEYVRWSAARTMHNVPYTFVTLLFLEFAGPMISP